MAQKNRIQDKNAVSSLARQSRSIMLHLMIIGGVALLVSAVSGRSLCPIYNIIGMPCASCGMTRAYRAILARQFEQAFRMHPLFWIVPVLATTPALHKKWPKIGDAVSMLLIALLILVWIFRMLMFFPSVEPMTFNAKALLPRLIEIFYP